MREKGGKTALLRRKVSKVFLRKQVHVAVVGVFLHVLAILMREKLRKCSGVNIGLSCRVIRSAPPKKQHLPICKDVFPPAPTRKTIPNPHQETEPRPEVYAYIEEEKGEDEEEDSK